MVTALSGSVQAPVLLGGTLAPRQLLTITGTFETSAGAFTSTGWSAGSNNTIGASALGEGHSGNYALKVTRSNATAGNAWAATTSSVTGFVSGQKYRMDAWVKKSAGATDPQVDIAIGVGGTFVSTSINATSTWTKISRIFTAASTGYTLYIRLGQTVAESGSAILVDDVSVIKYTAFEPLYASTSYVDLGQQGTISVDDLRDFVGTASTDVGVTMSATATISTAVQMVGETRVPVDQQASQMAVDALLAGSTGVDVRLSANALIFMPMPSATATAYARTATSGFSIVGILTPNPIGMVFDTNAINRIRSVPYIPPDPEPAAPGTPTVAQGVYVRALHGVIVDMTNPTITDGKPT